jgi:hypothetical protein
MYSFPSSLSNPFSRALDELADAAPVGEHLVLCEEWPEAARRPPK